ncbi:MAG TPA: PQQ-binding-like beta-propeller repeat protein [Planctomycetota bacterium]|nr:PQQ-binding-like beta-propeller repeat protein [Planctomycetota bacterium]
MAFLVSDSMRVPQALLTGLLAASVGYAAEGPRLDAAAAPRPSAAARLGDVLERVLATLPALGPQAEPAGDVTVDHAPRARPEAVLAEAQRAEQERNWRRAAELYQRLLGEAPGELCHPSPRLYVPMRVLVEERLASFPPEGLRAYRAQVERAAEALYKAAVDSGDLARVEDVARRFLLSTHGDDALNRLATAWLARGEAGRALRAWRRLLALCPDTDVPPAPLAAKLAVCLAELGRFEAARALLAQAAKELGAGAEVTVGGESIALADLRLPPEGRGRAGGIPSSAENAVRPGPILWADVIQSRKAAEAMSAFRPRRVVLDVDGETGEPSVRVLPTVADGAAVYPTRAGVAARDATSGKLRWEWPWRQEDSGWRGSGPFAMPSFFLGHWACSTDARSVYCSVPFQLTARIAEAGMGGHLVALDLRTGAQRWQRSAVDLLPEDRGGGGWFVSAPLACGERLVVGLRGGGAGDDYYLCCLRASDGALVWRRFVAARPSDPLYRLGRYQPWFEGMPAEGRGLVVACPGGGVAAGIELATGAIRWLMRYDQVGSRRVGWRWHRHDGWRTWTPLVSDGVAYVTPPDADFLYAVAVDTGEVLWRRERGDHRYLAGIHEEGVCIVGADATCLGPRGEVKWRAALPSPAVGRPALGGRVLHVPIAGGIQFLDAATGSELAWTSWEDWTTARGSTWSAHIASGDLLVAGGRLLVATPFTLNVFGPFERRESIERQLAAQPDDALTQYAKGQECHWEGDAAGAIEALERALELAARRPGAMSEPMAADARRRLAACHADLSHRHERSGRLDLALAACEAALRHAPRGDERRALLLRSASLARELRRWPAAVAALQEILALAGPGEGDWATARGQLDALLREAGRAPYEPFERAAAAALERGGEGDLRAVVRGYPNSLAAPAAIERLADGAERGGRPAEARLWLHQLVRDYPGAPRAADALRRLALWYAREGAVAMARGAAERLGRQYGGAVAGITDAVLDRHPKWDFRPPFRVGWDIRPDYGATQPWAPPGGADPSGAFLVLAGRSFECRAVEDGAVRWANRPGWIGIRIEDAERRGGGVRVVSTVSDVEDAPAVRAGLRGGDVLVSFDGKPLRDAQDLITVCTERGAGTTVQLKFLRGEEAHAVQMTLGARPSLPADADQPPVAFVGVVGGHAIVRKTTRLDAVSLERGAVAWSLPLEGGEMPAEEGTARSAAAAPGILALADSRGRLLAVDPATGAVLWKAQVEEPTVHDVVLWDHGLVVTSSRPATVRVINPFDGHVAFEASERHALGTPVVALDFAGRLCYAMGCSIGCWDAARREVAWSVRILNFVARRLWTTGTVVLAHGADEQGLEVLECRQSASGAPAWSLALARGERLLLAEPEADAFYIASRQSARVAVRRLDASTGQVAWTRTLERHEELGAWEASGATLALGLSVSDDQGPRRAELLALDKATGGPVQRLALCPGSLVSLSRLASSLCAVVESETDEARRPAWFGDEPMMFQQPRFRVLRITDSP